MNKPDIPIQENKPMPGIAWKKNDARARNIIMVVSVVLFVAIVIVGRVQLNVDLGFDEHIFAKINAIINSTVTVLLLSGFVAVKNKHYVIHKRIMLTALVLSFFFLVSYILHHLFAGDTSYGGTGMMRYVYFFILGTHIILAAIILPFILITTYRSMIGEWERHKKIAKITWPIWLYVAVTGVLVYVMISPYYE